MPTILLLSLFLSGHPAWAGDAASTGLSPAAAQSSAEVATVDLSNGWKLREDPRDGGMQAKWHTPQADDSRWEAVDNPWAGAWVPAGKSGRKGGNKNGAGRFWLRKRVDIPAGSLPRIFLSLSHSGEAMDVFINGFPLSRDLKGGVSSIREVSGLVDADGGFLLALRIKRSRTPTGNGAVRLHMANESRPLFPGLQEWVSFMAREYPLLAWPSWARGHPSMRAPVGLPGAESPAFVGGDGQLVPPDRSCVVSCWIHESGTGKFFAPGAVPSTFSLDERVLPIPEVSVRMGRFNMYLRFWADSMEEEPGVVLAVGEVTVENASDRTRHVELFIAAHPLLPWEESGERGGFLDMATVDHDPVSRVILVNKKPAVILTTPADAFIASPFDEGTVARIASTGTAGPARAEDRKLRLASGAAVYRLKIQPFGARTMTFRVFLSGRPDKATPEFTQAIRDVNRKWSQKESLNEWRRLLVGKERIFLRIPDKRAQDAFYASIGHLLAGYGVAQRGDTRVLAMALEQSGHPDAASTLTAGSAVSSSPLVAEQEALPGGTFRPASLLKEVRTISSSDPVMGASLLEKAQKRMSAPGAFAWGEIEDEATGRWVGGEMPGLAAAAEFVLTMRSMLIRDGGDFVELAPAVPPAWMKPGNQVEIKNAPTKHGPLSYAVTSRDSGFVVNLNVAPSAPAGCRWRVPGKRRIGKLVVDGRATDIPADRVVVIPPGSRRVAVIW